MHLYIRQITVHLITRGCTVPNSSSCGWRSASTTQIVILVEHLERLQTCLYASLHVACLHPILIMSLFKHRSRSFSGCSKMCIKVHAKRITQHYLSWHIVGLLMIVRSGPEDRPWGLPQGRLWHVPDNHGSEACCGEPEIYDSNPCSTGEHGHILDAYSSILLMLMQLALHKIVLFCSETVRLNLCMSETHLHVQVIQICTISNSRLQSSNKGDNLRKREAEMDEHSSHLFKPQSNRCYPHLFGSQACAGWCAETHNQYMKVTQLLPSYFFHAVYWWSSNARHACTTVFDHLTKHVRGHVAPPS